MNCSKQNIYTKWKPGCVIVLVSIKYQPTVAYAIIGVPKKRINLLKNKKIIVEH